MRLSTKLGASVSTAALGAAVVLGGAGVVHAQSLGSLGSSDPAPVVLTVSGDEDSVGGEITNNTTGPLTCAIYVSHADVIAAVERDFNGDMTFAQAIAANQDEFDDANELGQNAFVVEAVLAGATDEWTGGGTYGPDEDVRAGAAANCGGDNVAFAYEPGGLFGSLNMGSLGS